MLAPPLVAPPPPLPPRGRSGSSNSKSNDHRRGVGSVVLPHGKSDRSEEKMGLTRKLTSAPPPPPPLWSAQGTRSVRNNSYAAAAAAAAVACPPPSPPPPSPPSPSPPPSSPPPPVHPLSINTSILSDGVGGRGGSYLWAEGAPSPSLSSSPHALFHGSPIGAGSSGAAPSSVGGGSGGGDGRPASKKVGGEGNQALGQERRGALETVCEGPPSVLTTIVTPTTTTVMRTYLRGESHPDDEELEAPLLSATSRSQANPPRMRTGSYFEFMLASCFATVFGVIGFALVWMCCTATHARRLGTRVGLGVASIMTAFSLLGQVVYLDGYHVVGYVTVGGVLLLVGGALSIPAYEEWHSRLQDVERTGDGENGGGGGGSQDEGAPREETRGSAGGGDFMMHSSSSVALHHIHHNHLGGGGGGGSGSGGGGSMAPAAMSHHSFSAGNGGQPYHSRHSVPLVSTLAPALSYPHSQL